MKFIWLTILSVIITTNVTTGQSIDYKSGDTLNVFSINGLNVRSSPTTNDTIIVKLNYGDKIVLLKKLYKYDTIDKREGVWLKVKTKSGFLGFVFSGYTTKLPLPSWMDLSSSSGGCNDHILFKNWNLDILSETKILHSSVDEFLNGDERENQTIRWTLYEDGTIIRYVHMYEYTNMIIETNRIRLNDLLNFIDYQIYYSEKIGCTNSEFYKKPMPKVYLNNFFDIILEANNFADFKVFKFGNRLVCSIYHS